MIREAKVNDYWRESNRTKKYEYVFDTVLIDCIHGYDEIKIKKGIFAICGLNGVGKSTIISCIKDVIGIEKNENDYLKIGDTICTANIEKISNNIISNIDGERLVDYIGDSSIGSFIEYNDSLKVLNFLNQNNLEEYLDQFETNLFNKNDLNMIQYLVAKEYDSCSVTVIEDDEEGSIYPYFSVTTSGEDYNSLSMGLGEHYLFYLFWKLKSINKSHIAIIEEPETFISIKSQEKLMNFIAKIATEYGISFIITTHSPFILTKLETDNICVVSRYKNKTSINYYNDKTIILGKLGINIPTKGILFFEDKLAMAFFKSLAKIGNITHLTGQYDYEIAGSESEISERLKFKKSDSFKYKLLGIYDGDMKVNESKFLKSNSWPFSFLPGNECLEEEFREVMSNNVLELEKTLDLKQGRLESILADISGCEAHDWLNKLNDEIDKGYDELVGKLTNLWIVYNKQNKSSFEEFIKDIQKKLD